MGYIDKDKMLHDLYVKTGESIAKDDLLRTSLYQSMTAYVLTFPEEKGVSILEDDDVGVSYGDMMGDF